MATKGTRNGSTAREIFPTERFVTELRTNNTRPTGGVSSPIIKLKIMMEPSLIGSIPYWAAIGMITGTRISTAEFGSITVPINSKNILRIIKKTIGSSVSSNIPEANSCGTCSRPNTHPKRLAAAIISMIDPLMEAVDENTDLNCFRPRVLYEMPKTIMYKAAALAASVGVNIPPNIPPSTMTGVNKEKDADTPALSISFRGARGSRRPGLFREKRKTSAISTKVINSAGTTPARNRPPMDTPDTTPYTTAETLGGMMGPIRVDEAVSPTAKDSP